MSKWYEMECRVKKVLLFVMTKAQRQKYLSAGGIIDINVDAFGSVSINNFIYLRVQYYKCYYFLQVVRKSFSFYAILRNVLNK